MSNEIVRTSSDREPNAAERMTTMPTQEESGRPAKPLDQLGSSSDEAQQNENKVTTPKICKKPSTAKKESATATRPSLPKETPKHDTHIRNEKVSPAPERRPRKKSTEKTIESKTPKKTARKRSSTPSQSPNAASKQSTEEDSPTKFEKVSKSTKPGIVKDKHRWVKKQSIKLTRKNPIGVRSDEAELCLDDGLAKNRTPSGEVATPARQSVVSQKSPRKAKTQTPSRRKPTLQKSPQTSSDGSKKRDVITPNIQSPNPQKSQPTSNEHEEETLNVTMELAPRTTNNDQLVDTQKIVKKQRCRRTRSTTPTQSPTASVILRTFNDPDEPTMFEKISTPSKPAVVKENYRWLKKQSIKLTRQKPIGISSDSVASIREGGSVKATTPEHRRMSIPNLYKKLKERMKSSQSRNSTSATTSSNGSNSKHSLHRTSSTENSKKA